MVSIKYTRRDWIMKKIKKILLTFALTLCVIGSAFTFKACKCSKNDGSVSIKNVFAMSMVSATNYLEGSTPRSASEIDTETENTIKEYTNMFEELLSNTLNPTEGSIAESDDYYGTFHKKLSLTIGEEHYTMYFNEVVEGTEIEIDDDEIEEETTSFLHGIVKKVVGNDSEDYVEYSVVGSREIENETKKGVSEVESELKLIFTTEDLDVADTDTLDDINLNSLTDYVVIEQEQEDGEIEFEYTTKTPAMSHPKTVEIEYEDEDGKQTLEIKIKANSTKTKYEIEKVDTNKYSVKIKSNDNRVLYYLEKVDGDWIMRNV